MHKLQQRQLPLVLLGAGLPTIPRMAGEAKSYAERLFAYPVIGQLSQEDSYAALAKPTEQERVYFANGTLKTIYEHTQGYPYSLQEWGYQVWNQAEEGSECRSADLAGVMGVKSTALTPVRANLIRKGMVYSPRHGVLEYSVPLFGDYMRRTIPVFSAKD